MLLRRHLFSLALAAAIAVLPFATAKAQYYYPCSPFPLTWPFCIAGAAVGTAAAIVSAPFRGPYYYYGQPYYRASGYYRRQAWNRPSRSDHVARQLNRQELSQMRYRY